jgi:hypothetical protein
MQSRCQWLGSPYYLRAQCALLHLLHSVSFFGFGFARYTSMSYRCFRYLKMKNVDELTGGESWVCILFYLGCFFKHFHSFPQSVLCTRGFLMLCTLEAETLWLSSAQLIQLGFRNSKRSFWRGNLLWAVPRSLRRSAILKPFQVSFCNNRFENVTANAMLQKISSLLLRQKFWLHLECNRFDNLLPGSLILYIHII